LLNADEVKHAFCNIVDVNEELEEFLQQFDQAGTGYIDFNEFVEMVKTP
jgi:Ca2+-binding EF-hand superfamily protein